MGESSIKELNQDNFQKEVLESEKLVIIDFYSSQCGSCKSLEPILDEIITKFKDKIEIKKANIENNQELASKYHVLGLPNILFFKNGEVKDQIVGIIDASKLETKTKKHLE